jgi:serine/threonine-protein kinase
MQLAPGTVLGSRYRLLSVLGRGGMGTVYLVEHMGTGDRLALKLLHDNAARDYESLERFKREARAPAKIQSENVVKVVDADVAPELGGAPFLVMELLNGSDLQTLVKQHGRMPGDDLLRFLGQVARALDKAHLIGIVHRDLKPENLFLHHREDGSTVIKILDFGISRMSQASQTSGPAVMTQQGAVMGTPLYMAPEQAVGRVHMIGPATDLWSLGLIAVYLSTGEHYWQGTTIPDVLAKVLNHAVYPPSTRWPFLTPAFDQWFYRSCARDPSQRFGNASEQIAALHAALAAPPPTTGQGTPLSHQPTMASANGPMTSAPTALALQVPGLPIPVGTPMPGSGPPAIVKPTTDPMLSPPAITPPPAYAASPMRPSYAPPPIAAPGPGYRPSYPPPVGGSTNEPVITPQHTATPTKSALPLIAIAVGALFVTIGAALATWAVASRHTVAGTGSATASVPPSVTLTVPSAPEMDDAGLAKLHGSPTGTVTVRPTGTATVTAPTGTATVTAPTATTTTTATATATAPKQTPKQCREACVKECANEDDENSCLKQCFLECPPL